MSCGQTGSTAKKTPIPAAYTGISQIMRIIVTILVSENLTTHQWTKLSLNDNVKLTRSQHYANTVIVITQHLQKH